MEQFFLLLLLFYLQFANLFFREIIFFCAPNINRPTSFFNCSAVNSCPASPNGAGNVPVFTRKAVGRDHKYSYISNMPEGLSVKDSRIPVPLGVGGKSKEKEVALLI